MLNNYKVFSGVILALIKHYSVIYKVLIIFWLQLKSFGYTLMEKLAVFWGGFV